MSDRPQRIDIPTSGSLLAAVRPFRDVVEAKAKANGRQLDPSWFRDGPEDRPALYPPQKRSDTNE